LQGGSRVPAQALLQSGQPAEIEMPTMQYDLPPVWVDTVEQVNQTVKRITNRCEFFIIFSVLFFIPFFFQYKQLLIQ
jgi:hypothetical protein